jgi:hypothetical protein
MRDGGGRAAGDGHWDIRQDHLSIQTVIQCMAVSLPSYSQPFAPII